MTALAGPIACFGEVLLRLSAPPGTRLAHAPSLSLHCAGAEANVAAMLAQLGHRAELVSVLPKSPLGDLCAAELRRVGVATGTVIRSEGRLGLYFFEQPLGGGIVYDRAGSAFVEHADLFDWPALAAGISWFHLSGINLALGGKPAEAAVQAARAMRSAGVMLSFDVNHRASLWQGRTSADFDRVREVAGLADLLFASPRDVGSILDIEAADAARAAREAFAALPQLRTIASTRRSLDGNAQRLSVRLDTRDEVFETQEAALGPIVDRIGSGDAFAGAVIDGLVRGAPLAECADRALAAAVMKHGIAGDRWIGTREELDAFNPFAAGDIRR